MTTPNAEGEKRALADAIQLYESNGKNFAAQGYDSMARRCEENVAALRRLQPVEAERDRLAASVKLHAEQSMRWMLLAEKYSQDIAALTARLESAEAERKILFTAMCQIAEGDEHGEYALRTMANSALDKIRNLAAIAMAEWLSK